MLEVARFAQLRAYRAFLCDGRSPVSPGTRLDVFPLPPQAHLCGSFQTPGERAVREDATRVGRRMPDAIRLSEVPCP
jgi:hypothetical protein